MYKFPFIDDILAPPFSLKNAYTDVPHIKREAEPLHSRAKIAEPLHSRENVKRNWDCLVTSQPLAM